MHVALKLSSVISARLTTSSRGAVKDRFQRHRQVGGCSRTSHQSKDWQQGHVFGQCLAVFQRRFGDKRDDRRRRLVGLVVGRVFTQFVAIGVGQGWHGKHAPVAPSRRTYSNATNARHVLAQRSVPRAQPLATADSVALFASTERETLVGPLCDMSWGTVKAKDQIESAGKRGDWRWAAEGPKPTRCIDSPGRLARPGPRKRRTAPRGGRNRKPLVHRKAIIMP